MQEFLRLNIINSAALPTPTRPSTLPTVAVGSHDTDTPTHPSPSMHPLPDTNLVSSPPDGNQPTHSPCEAWLIDPAPPTYDEVLSCDNLTLSHSRCLAFQGIVTMFIHLQSCPCSLVFYESGKSVRYDMALVHLGRNFLSSIWHAALNHSATPVARILKTSRIDDPGRLTGRARVKRT